MSRPARRRARVQRTTPITPEECERVERLVVAFNDVEKRVRAFAKETAININEMMRHFRWLKLKLFGEQPSERSMGFIWIMEHKESRFVWPRRTSRDDVPNATRDIYTYIQVTGNVCNVIFQQYPDGRAEFKAKWVTTQDELTINSVSAMIRFSCIIDGDVFVQRVREITAVSGTRCVSQFGHLSRTITLVRAAKGHRMVISEPGRKERFKWKNPSEIAATGIELGGESSLLLIPAAACCLPALEWI